MRDVTGKDVGRLSGVSDQVSTWPVPLSPYRLKKMPKVDEDGTPFCLICRRFGELSRMVPDGISTFRSCERWARKVYTVPKLTYAEMMRFAPCPGCGAELVAQHESSCVNKPHSQFTDAERAAYEQAEQDFRDRHPRCHAGRWAMQGSIVFHCQRCCPFPPLSPAQLDTLRYLLSPSPYI